uniref:Uncharacterized protein n=1 Tax=Cucumis melo TaxID=3656 RepID=A0A9I9CX85_CUCME
MGGENRVNGEKIEAKTGMRLSFYWRIWDKGGSLKEWELGLKTNKEREGKMVEKRRRRRQWRNHPHATELRDGEASGGGGGDRPWIPTSEIDFEISIIMAPVDAKVKYGEGKILGFPEMETFH